MVQINKLAVDFGMPVGSIELAHRIELDICFSGQSFEDFL